MKEIKIFKNAEFGSVRTVTVNKEVKRWTTHA